MAANPGNLSLFLFNPATDVFIITDHSHSVLCNHFLNFVYDIFSHVLTFTFVGSYSRNIVTIDIRKRLLKHNQDTLSGFFKASLDPARLYER